ncbi:hypothetical protein OG226_40590 [Streptomyces sp. NBC_01261]|uniref:hypothetical protein n=1 Tax=unclassified Streptomyces TaxID=2593676 RepID=UPI002E2AE284|nr:MULTISPECIES: hypothetical protein [unclassified Streptomyces]
MWPGQQPPGGEQNPQDNPYQQPGYQQPNPYQQPGYQQPSPYGQQPQWGAPGSAGGPQPPQPPQGGGGGNRTKLVAIIAATAVVVAAGVTGFLVLGGNKDDKADGGKDKSSRSPSTSADPSASSSGSDDNPRGNETEKPTIAGWKVVVNQKYGTAFDVPPTWEVGKPGTFSFFEDEVKGDGSPYIGFSAPAYLKENWCESDDNKDGTKETSSLASSGTKGEDGAKDTASTARGDAASFAFGGYTDQKDSSKKYLKIGAAKPYTTKSGVAGSVATSYTSGVPKTGKCSSDGKATTFAFKNSADDFVSWTLYGAKGVSEEIPDATIQKILSTVRLHGDPTGSTS